MTDDPVHPETAAPEPTTTVAPEPSSDLPVAPPLVPPSGTDAPAVVEPLIPPSPTTPTAPSPALVSTRALLGASFELLTRTSGDLRRASFYIGGIVLGTAGPAALALWAVEVIGVDPGFVDLGRRGADLSTGEVIAVAGLSLLFLLAGLGVFVAFIESRTLAMAILGGFHAGRPLTVRESVARSRRTFWRAILVGILVGLPVLVAQFVVDTILNGSGHPGGAQEQLSLLTSTLISALVGAPIAYVLAGVVLGGVDPFESLRRSVRVFNARRPAAVLVAGFETVAGLLLVLGLGSGLDLVMRFVALLGLGPTSGPLGLAIVTMLIVAGVFALGTLLFTVYALTIAPQVVMFVGLTHATYGLDTVRPGGRDDPAAERRGVLPFRWYTRPMLLGFILGGLGLALVVVALD